MRFLTYIFSVYIFMLALMPCTDASAHEMEKHVKTHQSSNTDHPHEHEDSCPPLCVCNCCGSIVEIIHFEKISFRPSVFTLDKGMGFVIQSPYFDYSHSIWQPPKI